MFRHRSIFSRALRLLSFTTVLALAAALLPAAMWSATHSAPAAERSGKDPGGNNGTVKIAEYGTEFDSIPNNQPHVGCKFTVEWYGFDKGDHIISKVKFEMQSPTRSVGLTVDGPSEVFVGGDSASGAGTSSGLDGRQVYTLSFDGPPHPNQGYHVKLTIATPGSKGNDKKYKVFWVQGCDPVVPPNPAIRLEKSVKDSNDADSIGSLGETLTYSFKVTNTGNVPLTNVTITDTKLGMTDVPCVANLAVGQTKSCPTRDYVVTPADIAAGEVHNTATAKGTPPSGPPVQDDDDAKISTPARPAIVVHKSVKDSDDADSVAEVGETLTYTFVVTNTGNVPLTNVTITDAKLSMTNVACVAHLAVGETKTCPPKTYVVTQSDVDAGKVRNTAVAKGTPPSGPPVEDDDDANIPTKKTNAPGIDMEKSVTDSDDADQIGSLGETLTYTFVVTNTGNVPLTNVTITDAKLSMTNVACVAHLAVGETKTCPPKTYVVTAADIENGSVHNVATGTGHPPTGPPVDDEDDADYPTPARPAIHLDKSVADSNDADTVAEQGEVLTYTFVVTNTGNVPLSNVTITDARLGMTDVACVASLAVGASHTCPPQSYTTTAGDVADGSVRNTATAKGRSPQGTDVSDDDNAKIFTKASQANIFLAKEVFDSNDPDSVGSLGETLTYTFHVTNTGDVDLTDVTISDPMFSLTNAPCVAFLAVGDTTDCPLLPAQSHTVTQADVDRGSVDNTATTSGTPPTGPKVTDDDTATIPVTGGGGGGNVDLVLDKSSDVAVAAPGDTVVYTINVRNQGPGDADDVVVTDTLPQGTTYVSSSAPCTHAGGTVTCALGTIDAGDDRIVTITVKVNASANGGGNTTHQHHLDYTKVESHMSAFAGDTTGTTQCPNGSVATDGSVRLDHVDQGTGGFEDLEVIRSAVTPDGKGWVGTVRHSLTGQVQAKVTVVCATESTTSGEDHSHPLVISGPVASSPSFGPGRHVVELACAPGSYPIQPSYVLTSGAAVVGTQGAAHTWQFILDVPTSVSGTFSIHCLSPALGTVQGHSHDLLFAELSDTVTVPAGGTVERKLTCADGYKGIVAWANGDPGLVSRGNDPQPITRVFKFYNPTNGPLTARFGLLCVAIRSKGGDHPGSKVTNTASAATSSHDTNPGNNSDSATVSVNPTGVAVTPRAAVVKSSGRTAVRFGLESGTKRPVTLKLVAAGKVAGLKGGTVLAKGRTKVKAGSVQVRINAKGAGAKALRSGKVGKAKLIVISRGQKDVRVIKLR